MGSVGAGSKAQQVINQIKQNPLVQKYGNSSLALSRAIEQSDYARDRSDIKNDLYSQIKEKGQVDITSFRYKTVPDIDGYADVDVSYTVTNSNLTGGRDLGTGKAVIKTKQKEKYKIVRVKVLDI